MKVLVAEDDPRTRQGLLEILANEGYQAIPARDGREALALFRSEDPEVVCLDVMMPEVNGYDVCREIRRENPDVPVLFISAKSEEVDTVVGLELGADDFIVKPFGVKAVVARIRAVTRRCLGARRPAGPTAAAPFTLRDLRVVPSELRAYRGEAAIDLGLRDVKILQLLHLNAGKALDRDTLFDACWGVDYFPASRSLDQHISQLRKRIEVDPKHPAIILTVHGVGYRFEG